MMKSKNTGIKMTKKNRLAILKGAQKILSNERNWTTRALRRREPTADDGYGYCLLGACEKAAYDLGLAEPSGTAFRTGEKQAGLGYRLGLELSLTTYSRELHGTSPDGVNDHYGYNAVMELLAGYIMEVQEGRAREA